jgi:hypothetical protein
MTTDDVTDDARTHWKSVYDEANASHWRARADELRRQADICDARALHPTARPAPSVESQALTVIAAELLRRAYTAEEKPVREDELRHWSLRAKAVADATR